jgi:hypothetical protein
VIVFSGNIYVLNRTRCFSFLGVRFNPDELPEIGKFHFL